MIALYLAIAPLVAQAVDKAGDMAMGAWTEDPRYLTFGSCNGHPLVWRVLEVKDSDSDFSGVKTAFLLLDDLLRSNVGEMEAFEFGSSNSFPNSKIKKWLNDGEKGFMAGLVEYQADILDTTYSPGNAPRKWSGGPVSGTSKIFLLSAEEANNVSYFASDADRVADNKVWWLRSPGFKKDIAAIVIVIGSVAQNGLYVSSRNGVRPALKISLSPSSVFADLPVSYGLSVKTDDGSNPIGGAKAILAPSLTSQSKESYSNSVGIARFANVAPGAYTVAVSKPGFETKSEDIIVPAAPAVTLTPDAAALPGKVKFGKYNGEPIEWDVLDIVNSKALLLAGALFEMYFDNSGSSTWANSSLRAYMNSANAGGFLNETNFTAEEAAAINVAASATGDSVFLLSSEEVFKYMPDADMRAYNGIKWHMRTPFDGADVEAISPSGDYCTNPAYERGIFAWSRPAAWVDLEAIRN